MIRKIKKLLFITVTTIIIGFTLTGCDAEATDNIEIAEIYLFLWELRIKIKIMPQAEFERMVGKLTAEQKVYAIYFRIF